MLGENIRSKQQTLELVWWLTHKMGVTDGCDLDAIRFACIGCCWYSIDQGRLQLVYYPEVGAFYWTVLAPDIVNPGREEQGSVSV